MYNVHVYDMYMYLRTCVGTNVQVHVQYLITVYTEYTPPTYTVSDCCVQAGELVYAALPRCDATTTLCAPRGPDLRASAGSLLLPVRGHQH